MSKSKEEIIKAVDDLQKRVEGLEASGDPTDKANVEKYETALTEIANLKAKIREIEEWTAAKLEGENFAEDW